MLDQADRYLNAHSAKYAFKHNLVDKARDTMVLFSKDQDTQKMNVHEMATMWYENHGGLANLRLGHLRQSLKSFYYIPLHFNIMLDDCHDF
jgi:hypothetical protein